MRLMDRELAQETGIFTCCNRRVNARLLKLCRAGLLNRFFIGSIGSGRKAIYVLSRKGAALVGSSQRLVSRRFGESVLGDLFVDHQLRVNRVYAAVKSNPLPQGASFKSWRTFAKPVAPATPLIPDAYFELQTTAGARAQFLEVDMGTETRSVWERKTRGYLHLARSGEFQRIFAQPQFRVLVLVPSEKRLENIRVLIAKHTAKIFYLATFQSINQSGLWSACWLRPTGDQRQSLL
jgi:hypothetical protein